MEKTRRITEYHDLSSLGEEIIEDLEGCNYRDYLNGQQVVREDSPFYIIYVEDGLGDDPSLHYAPVSPEGYEKLKGVEGISYVNQVNTIK